MMPDISNETLALREMPRGYYEYLRHVEPFLRNQSEDCLYLSIYAAIGNLIFTFLFMLSLKQLNVMFYVNFISRCDCLINNHSSSLMMFLAFHFQTCINLYSSFCRTHFYHFLIIYILSMHIVPYVLYSHQQRLWLMKGRNTTCVSIEVIF